MCINKIQTKERTHLRTSPNDTLSDSHFLLVRVSQDDLLTLKPLTHVHTFSLGGSNPSQSVPAPPPAAGMGLSCLLLYRWAPHL